MLSRCRGAAFGVASRSRATSFVKEVVGKNSRDVEPGLTPREGDVQVTCLEQKHS